MAIKTVPGFVYPVTSYYEGGTSWRQDSDINLNEVNDEWRHGFIWGHETTSIETVKIKLLGTVDTGTITCQFYTMDTSTNPYTLSSTVGGSDTYDWTGTDDNTVITFDLSGSPPALTRGTAYVCSFKCTAVAGALPSVSILHGERLTQPVDRDWNTISTNAGVSFFNTNGNAVIAVYDGGGTAYSMQHSYPPGATGVAESSGSTSNLGNATFTTATTYDETGNTFVPEVRMRASGLYFGGQLLGNATLKLYADPAGTPTLLESVAITPGMQYGYNTGWYNFPSLVTLEANTKYAVTALATDASGYRHGILNVDASADRGTLPWGMNHKWCERDGSTGAFAEDSLRLAIGLGVIINGLEDGSPSVKHPLARF